MEKKKKYNSPKIKTSKVQPLHFYGIQKSTVSFSDADLLSVIPKSPM